MLWLMIGCTQNTGLGTKPEEQDVVNGSGGITLEPAEAVIESCEVGFSRSTRIVLTSTGDANLLIYGADIISGGDVFFTDAEEDLPNSEFAPEQGKELTFVATLESDAPAEGVFRLRTNDPEHGQLDVPLRAYPVGYEPPADTGGTDTGSGDTGGADSGTGA